jgi:anaerobic selenocysteine-containing dehydrogenase
MVTWAKMVRIEMADGREVTSFCRICSGSCGTILTLDGNDRLLSVRGDKAHPLTMGYACVKGLQVVEAHNRPDRILRPLKRKPDGSFEPIGLERALDEIAGKLSQLRVDHGPESIAAYRGTQNSLYTAAQALPQAFIRAVGSHGYYTSLTVDQSAKPLTAERLGAWHAGRQAFADSDVSMFFGNNPLVSIYGINGFPTYNPTKRIKDAKARGLKLIVVDPRRTETAQYAELFLQPRPGEDASIAAGMLRIILAEGWTDSAFCDAHVEGLERLRAAVEPFTEDYVAERAGIDAADLRRAAEIFAKADRGVAGTGTGPNMARRSNLAEHLIECLNVVCGRYLKAGEAVPNPGVLNARAPVYAEVVPPSRNFEKGHKSTGGYGTILGEMMSAILADEILTPGPQQVRSLLVMGGNPADAFPNQQRIDHALRRLELLVAVDPFMSRTARLAHYILPPPLLYERSDMSRPYMEKRFLPMPFAQYTPPVVRPPEGAELADDCYVIWALAKRMGLQLVYAGVPLDMETPPSPDDLMRLMLRGAAVTLDELKEYPRGHVFDVPPLYVSPARPGAAGRFAVAPPDVLEEIEQMLAEYPALRASAATFPFQLTTRRIREAMNSTYRDLPAIHDRVPYNPLWMHPDDMAALGIGPSGRVLVASAHDEIEAIARADGTLRRGVVSMTHGFGPDARAGGVYDREGASVNRLVGSDDLEPLNAMPRFSGIRVDVRPLEDPAAAPAEQGVQFVPC